MRATKLAAGIAAVALLTAGCGGGVDKKSAAYTSGRDTGFTYAKSGFETGGSNPNDFKSECEGSPIVDWESKQPDPVAAMDTGNAHHKEFIAGCVDGIKAALK